ncbi:MAG: hypothetical protein K8R21_09980, partial [Leptospira sp.]|nr:hypothetical protein [Leptospira sp.]
MRNTKNKELNLWRRHALFALAVLFLWSLAIRLHMLFKSPYAMGMDGYYYAGQVKSLFEKGRFFSPDSSPVIYLLAFFSKLGTDIVVTNKITISLLSASLIFPAYLLGKKIAGPLCGIMIASVIVSNSFSMLFAIDYVKNLGGILFFLFFLGEFLELTWNPGNRKHFFLFILFFILTFFSHKLMGGISLIFVFFFSVYFFRKNWKIVLLTSGLIAIPLILSAFFIPNLLHSTDLIRFEDTLSAHMQFPPASYLANSQTSIFHKIEVWVFFLSPAFLFFTKENSPELKFFLLSLLFLFLFLSNPYFKFDSNDLAFRLFLLLFIPGSIFIGIALKGLKPVPLFFVAIMLCALQIQASRIYENKNFTDYALYDRLIGKIGLPENSLLVVHQGFDYFYCYKTRKDSFHFLPEEKHKGRPVYRIAYGLSPNLLYS